MLTTAQPYDWRSLAAAAYTYALIHTPSQRVYFGYATAVRKSLNMWDMRLRNPHGNPGVPVAFKAFDWTHDQWVFKLGTGYGTIAEARAAQARGINGARAKGMVVLNGTVYMPTGQRPRSASPPAPKMPVRPSYVHPPVLAYSWPAFLPWLMAHPDNHIGNPSDAQVRGAWYIWHELQGTTATMPVPDPDRDARRRKAETNRRNQQAWRARQKAKRIWPPLSSYPRYDPPKE
jgi:hypothetical protein